MGQLLLKIGSSCQCRCQRCSDSCATNYNASDTAVPVCADKSCCEYPSEPVRGCTNNRATNYNRCATVDDGSCVIGGPCSDSECCPGETGHSCGTCSGGAPCCMCQSDYAPSGENCSCVYVGEQF